MARPSKTTTPHTNKEALPSWTPAGVHTRNFFTPLYTESQETDHTAAYTGHQTPQPPNERLDTINEAEEEELAAAAPAEAEAHRTS